MKKTVGKVFDVYIPEQFNNGNLLDVMDRTNIAFKVMTENGEREIITEANEETGKIMKNDLVEIIEQNISGKEFVDIRLFEGEDYE